ncbi:DUF4123 domain-containing protein [Marinomonas sp. PE14-40]|uniref:DUF4123 domain-containing protein n=1 Tax=Marinomonas sp. PE14-40 TaxID=3060621 RepID=UPI003F66F92B
MIPEFDEYTNEGLALKWYALIPAFKDMKKIVYQNLKSENATDLYVGTPLAALTEQTPLLIELDENSQFHRSLTDTQAMFFSATSDQTFQDVLQHLQARLYVIFNGTAKGIFHFYTPSVASYFFTESDIEDTAEWLSPLHSVWLYQTKAWGDARWQQVINQNKSIHEDDWVLRPSQEAALALKYDDAFIQVFLTDKSYDHDSDSYLKLREVHKHIEYWKISELEQQYAVLDLALSSTQALDRIAQAMPNFEHFSVDEKLVALKESVEGATQL